MAERADPGLSAGEAATPPAANGNAAFDPGRAFPRHVGDNRAGGAVAGTFDFLAGNPRYTDSDIHRMNMRERFIVTPFGADLKDARVLDLAAHDGRWSYALSRAGAREVLGIEGRPELVARFNEMPPGEPAGRVRLVVGDIFEGLERLVAAGAVFDVVALFGIFYHVMDHFLLLQRISALGPRLVIVDSEFIHQKNPMIQLVRERTDNPLNAIPQHPGQEVAIKGVPSTGAMEAMAEALGYDCTWQDWLRVPVAERQGLGDYFRDTQKRRATCALRPHRRAFAPVHHA